jgi:hypothetical protein
MSLSYHLLEEYAALEHILLGDLRDVLEEPADEETRTWLTVILDSLLAIVPRAFALKAEGGYLQEVVAAFPDWDDQVVLLQRDHGVLCSRLQHLRARLATGAAYAALADRLRRDLRDWMDRLGEHQRCERRLMQTAANLEIGVGD